MTLPSYYYRDPSIVLEEKQQHELRRSCHGCKHIIEVVFKSEIKRGCGMGKQYGRRCKFYRVDK